MKEDAIVLCLVLQPGNKWIYSIYITLGKEITTIYS